MSADPLTQIDIVFWLVTLGRIKMGVWSRFLGVLLRYPQGFSFCIIVFHFFTIFNNLCKWELRHNDIIYVTGC